MRRTRTIVSFWTITLGLAATNVVSAQSVGTLRGRLTGPTGEALDIGTCDGVRSRYSFTVGADNVFDIYPDRNVNSGDPATTNGGISNFGIFPYNAISPFGFSGRFVYTKLSLGLR